MMSELNRALVQTLGAEVIVTGALRDATREAFEERLALTANRYGGFGGGRVIGTIINRVPTRDEGRAALACVWASRGIL